MNNPKISIIVPVYNTEKYLARCIESITSQTYRNFELIAVNDGSTDNSIELLENIAKKDERVIIINHEKNKRQAGGDDSSGIKRSGRPPHKRQDKEQKIRPMA